VPVGLAVDGERQCEGVEVVDGVLLEVEVDSVLEVVVGEVGVDSQEVEVEASRREEGAHLEEADLEEDEARWGVICGNFNIWRSAPV
jgi:hypothetical protein